MSEPDFIYKETDAITASYQARAIVSICSSACYNLSGEDSRVGTSDIANALETVIELMGTMHDGLEEQPRNTPGDKKPQPAVRYTDLEEIALSLANLDGLLVELIEGRQDDAITSTLAIIRGGIEKEHKKLRQLVDQILAAKRRCDHD